MAGLVTNEQKKSLKRSGQAYCVTIPTLASMDWRKLLTSWEMSAYRITFGAFPAVVPSVKFLITFQKKKNSLTYTTWFLCILATVYNRSSRYLRYEHAESVSLKCLIIAGYAGASWIRDALLFLQPQFAPHRNTQSLPVMKTSHGEIS
jgi:hypothetical protein